MADTLLRNTPCQGRSIRTVTAILDAAERLIAEAGQVTFTAAELATAAGMSIGRVYYWYSDLGSVMVAVRQRIARAFEDAHVLAAGGFDLEHVVDQVLVEHPAAVVLCFVGLQAERDVVRWSDRVLRLRADRGPLRRAEPRWHPWVTGQRSSGPTTRSIRGGVASGSRPAASTATRRPSRSGPVIWCGVAAPLAVRPAPVLR